MGNIKPVNRWSSYYRMPLVKNTRKYRLEMLTMMIGDGYQPEVGFVPRNNFLRFIGDG